MENKNILYTITVFSENTVGLLNQITSIFNRRRINIETLSVSPSAIEGIHKFMITIFSDIDTIKIIVKQIDKKVGVIKAFFHTDDDLIHEEIALYKISTDKIFEMGSIEDIIRKYNAQIIDFNTTWTVIEKIGQYTETQSLFKELSEKTGVLQFIRSGRIAITRSKVERLSDLLAEMEKENKKLENKLSQSIN